jgi:hypothetical protein
VKRLDSWLSSYLGADDSRYIRHVGAKMLIAAVRRVYHTGAKFDQMVILEGAQGTGKSTALQTLAIDPDWFTDNFALTDDSRKVLEQTEGKLIIEAAEMTGIRKADIEHVKALLSRTHDRARKAYGHFVTEVPRQFIFIGTTNGGAESPYLVDPSGHRRSWPVKTGKIDLASLRRDVDQLWAEAVSREREKESIVLPPDLWDDARQEQEKRALEDPWVIALEDGLGDMLGKVLAEDVWTFMGKADKARPMGEPEPGQGHAEARLGAEEARVLRQAEMAVCTRCRSVSADRSQQDPRRTAGLSLREASPGPGRGNLRRHWPRAAEPATRQRDYARCLGRVKGAKGQRGAALARDGSMPRWSRSCRGAIIIPRGLRCA